MKINSLLNVLKRHRAIRIVLIVIVGLLVLNLLLLAWGNSRLKKSVSEAGGESALNPYALKGERPKNDENASLNFDATRAILSLEDSWGDKWMKKKSDIREVLEGYLTEDGFIPSASQEQVLREIVDECSMIYQIMADTDGCTTAYYVGPEGRADIDDVPNFLGHQITVYAMAAKAITAAQENDPNTAYLWNRRMIRCSGWMAKETPTLISTLIAIGCSHISTQTLEVVMNLSPPDREQRDLLRKQLTDLKNSVVMRSALEGERAISALAIEECTDKGFVYEAGLNRVPGPVLWLLKYPGRFLISLNKAFVLDEFNLAVEMSDLPRYQILERLGGEERKYEFPPYAFIASIIIPNWVKCLERQDAFHADLEVLDLALSLMDYKEQTGDYPETLQALVPDKLDRLPLDPFSGKNFIYRQEGQGFIVYSLSLNGQDDGGKVSDDWKEGDIVFRFRH